MHQPLRSVLANYGGSPWNQHSKVSDTGGILKPLGTLVSSCLHIGLDLLKAVDFAREISFSLGNAVNNHFVMKTQSQARKKIK